MNIVFYIASVVAILATLRVITAVNAFHALLYLIASLLAVSLVFFVIGAPFIAALEVIIYAGAIMVLFVFVIMMLNQGPQSIDQERNWLRKRMWVGPGILTLILLSQLIYVIASSTTGAGTHGVEPRAVGAALFGPYVVAVELVSVLLLAGLVGAYYLGHREPVGRQETRQ